MDKTEHELVLFDFQLVLVSPSKFKIYGITVGLRVL